MYARNPSIGRELLITDPRKLSYFAQANMVRAGITSTYGALQGLGSLGDDDSPYAAPGSGVCRDGYYLGPTGPTGNRYCIKNDGTNVNFTDAEGMTIGGDPNAQKADWSQADAWSNNVSSGAANASDPANHPGPWASGYVFPPAQTSTASTVDANAGGSMNSVDQFLSKLSSAIGAATSAITPSAPRMPSTIPASTDWAKIGLVVGGVGIGGFLLFKLLRTA